MPSRPAGRLRRGVGAGLVALAAAVAVALAVPQPASSSTSFTRTALTATVTGTSVQVSTAVRASRRTAATSVGVCVRGSQDENLDFPLRPATLSGEPTALRGTRTFAPGRYTAHVCVEVDGRWHRAGGWTTFTVVGPPQAAGLFTPETREDFDTPAGPGTVLDTYAGSLVAYEDNARYRRENLSVHDGVLDLTLTGRTGAAVVLGPPDSVWGRRYGRFDVTFKAVGGSGQGAAVLLWPTSDRWTEGELDFPEGPFDQPVRIYHHPTPCGEDEGGPLPLCRSFQRVDTAGSWRDWHTASIEWVPGEVRYHLDGHLVWATAEDVPSTPHRLTVQSAPGRGRAEPGHLLISSYVIARPAD